MEHQVVYVTLDNWTTKAKQNYSGMTAHHIDGNWILRQHNLWCFLNEWKTTATEMKEEYLKKLCNKLDLEHLPIAANGNRQTLSKR
jgi:hypothetical protein